MLRVRKSIDVRFARRGRQSQLGLERLKVGESVLIPASDLAMKENDAPNQPLQRVRARVSAFNRQWRLTNQTDARIFKVGVPDHRGVRIARVQ